MKNEPRIALATITETRERFRKIRTPMVEEEINAISWLKKDAQVLESPPLISVEDVKFFANSIKQFDAHVLVIHIPVWTDPVLSVKLSQMIDRPLVLVGNLRKDTSSMVGLLGSGGALNQVGIKHKRIFNHSDTEGQEAIRNVIRAAFVIKELKGQTMGLFGGRSLGMISAVSDPAQWHRKFGVDIEHIDQMEIVKEAEQISADVVEKYVGWLKSNCMKISFDNLFTEESLARQIRSYLATKTLLKKRNLDFVGVKCQPELADGYTTQCLAHMLCNSTNDADGEKNPVVHACEADMDAALTMQILNLISNGKPVALLDMRWLDVRNGLWTLANCGAFPMDFGATESDKSGLSSVEIAPHIIGKVGACALPMVASPQKVTLARLCRNKGKYWMAIIRGEIQQRNHEDLKKTTAVFPQAYVKTTTGYDFLEKFGSNHCHMVAGDFAADLKVYCELTDIGYQIWD